MFFETEDREKAVMELEATKEKCLSKFCPVINKKCREDCASFNAGTVREMKYGKDRPSKFTIYSANCCNAIINGSIELEQ